MYRFSDLEAGGGPTPCRGLSGRRPVPEPFHEHLLSVIAGNLGAADLCALSTAASGLRCILDQHEALPVLRATVEQRGWLHDLQLWEAAHSAVEGGYGELTLSAFLRQEGVRLRKARRSLDEYRAMEHKRIAQEQKRLRVIALASFSVVPAHCYAKSWCGSALQVWASTVQCFGASLFLTLLYLLVPSMKSLAVYDAQATCYGSLIPSPKVCTEHTPLLVVWWLPVYWAAARHFISCPAESMLYDFQFVAFAVFAAHARCLLLRFMLIAIGGWVRSGVDAAAQKLRNFQHLAG